MYSVLKNRRPGLFVNPQGRKDRALPRLGKQVGCWGCKAGTTHAFEQETSVAGGLTFELPHDVGHPSFAGRNGEHKKVWDAPMRLVYLSRDNFAVCFDLPKERGLIRVRPGYGHRAAIRFKREEAIRLRTLMGIFDSKQAVGD